MNVVLITTDFPPLFGGIATYTRQIAEHLSPLSRVYVVAPRFHRVGNFNGRAPVPYTIMRAWDPLFLRELHMLYLCMKFLRKLDGKTILIATTWFPSGIIAYCLWRLFGHPYYVVTHASDFLDDKHSWRRRIKYRLRSLKHLVFGKAEGIVAVSHFTAGLLLSQGVSNGMIHVVHNGADTRLFQPRKIGEDLRQRKAAGGKPILLTVCRLDPHKGVDLMIKAIPFLCEEFPNLTYVVIGKGPEYGKLLILAESLGIKDRVKFLGHVQEQKLATWYNICDIHIMLSHEIPGRTDLIEGFGISFVEAAACGKPSVACRFGGATEAVKDGETGFLIDVPPQITEVVHVVGQLLRSETLRKKLGQEGQRRVETELNWKFAAKKLIEIFEWNSSNRRVVKLP